ncbi:MAG: HAD family phosphatase [Bdellovibrionota bacterium]
MLKCLIFDIGNVVLKFSHEKACLQLAEVFKTTAESIQKCLFASGMHLSYESGQITTEELLKELKMQLGYNPHDEAIADAFNDMFEIVDGIEQLFLDAVNKNFRIMALSNISALNANYIENKWPNIFSKFDVKIYSFLVGAVKPESAIYHSAIEKSGLLPQECFYTDDLIQNIDAGRRHGLHAALFTDVKSYRKSLAEYGVLL